MFKKRRGRVLLIDREKKKKVKKCKNLNKKSGKSKSEINITCNGFWVQ